MIRDSGRNQAGVGREYGDGEGESENRDRQGAILPQIHSPAQKADPAEEEKRDVIPSGTRRR